MIANNISQNSTSTNQNSTPIAQNLDFSVAGGVGELTNGTPTYAYIVLNQQKTFNSVSFISTVFGSNAVYELGWYTWAATGTVSKASPILGNYTQTASGVFTIPFSSPVTLPAGKYNLGILKVSGSANLLLRSGISSSVYMFLGAAGASVLPENESTRTSQSSSPYMEFN